MQAVLALARLHGRAFLLLGAPLLLAWLMIGGVLFGRHGLDPRDVVHAMRSSLAVRAALLLAWTAMARPITQPLFFPPGGLWARTAPIGRWVQVLVSTAFAVLVQLPWLALLVRGGGTTLALPSVLTALALAAVAGRGVALLLSMLALTFFVASAPLAVTTPVAACACVLAIEAGHREAPLRRRARLAWRVRLPSFLALCLSSMRVLLREEWPRVVRTWLLGGCVVGFVVMQARGEPDADLVARAMVTAAIASLLAIAALGRAVGRTRRRFVAFTRASGRSPRTTFVASALVLAMPAISLGLLLAIALRARPLLVMSTGALVSFATASIAARFEDRLAAARRDDAVRWLLVSLAIGALAAACALRPIPGMIALVLLAIGAISVKDAEVPLARA